MFTDEEPKTIGCGISQIVADFELPNPVASQRLIELEDNNPHFIEDVDVVIETVDVTRLATNIAQGIIAFPAKDADPIDSSKFRVRIGQGASSTTTPKQLLAAIGKIPEYISGSSVDVAVQYIELYADMQGTHGPTPELPNSIACLTEPVTLEMVTHLAGSNLPPRKTVKYGRARSDGGIAFEYTQTDRQTSPGWRVSSRKVSDAYDPKRPAYRLTAKINGGRWIQQCGGSELVTELADGALQFLWQEVTTNWFKPIIKVDDPGDPDRVFWKCVQSLDFMSPEVSAGSKKSDLWSLRVAQHLVSLDHALQKVQLQKNGKECLERARQSVEALFGEAEDYDWGDKEVGPLSKFSACMADSEVIWGSMFHSMGQATRAETAEGAAIAQRTPSQQ